MKTAKKKKTAPVAVEPRPQIPTMMGALRRQRESFRALIDGLEAKLRPVLHAGEPRPDVALVPLADASPVAEALNESISIMASLNGRLRDLTARLEV